MGEPQGRPETTCPESARWAGSSGTSSADGALLCVALCGHHRAGAACAAWSGA